MACSETVALIIFDAEPNQMSLEEVVAKLRAEGSASAKSSLLVMAEPGTEEQARELIGNGVNRVMMLNDPEDLIEQQVADLLHIAPRAAVRFATRLYTSLDNGTEEVFGQTANLSISGMLVQTPTLLEPGQRVVFEILIEDREGAVIGDAEIIRHAVRGSTASVFDSSGSGTTARMSLTQSSRTPLRIHLATEADLGLEVLPL